VTPAGGGGPVQVEGVVDDSHRSMPDGL